MSSITKFLVLAAALAIVVSGGSGGGVAQDRETILKNRKGTMKEQGKDVGAVKAYLDGKGDLAQAKTGAANLTQTTKKIPELFPPGTGGPNPTGDYVAKPEIWTDWNKFLDAQKAAATKADTLLVAGNSGDNGANEAAFNRLRNNGCGALHKNFLRKIAK